MSTKEAERKTFKNKRKIFKLSRVIEMNKKEA